MYARDMRAILPRMRPQLRQYDRRIRIGRQRFGDRCREVGDEQRFLRLLSNRAETSASMLFRAPLLRSSGRVASRGHSSRGVSRSARATTSTDSCRSRCRRRAVSANSCTRAGSGRRRGALERHHLALFVAGDRSSSESPPSLPLVQRLRAAEAFGQQFRGVLLLHAEARGQLGNAEAFEKPEARISWYRGERHSSASRAASWFGRLSRMFLVAGSIRSNSGAASGERALVHSPVVTTGMTDRAEEPLVEIADMQRSFR